MLTMERSGRRLAIVFVGFALGAVLAMALFALVGGVLISILMGDNPP